MVREEDAWDVVQTMGRNGAPVPARVVAERLKCSEDDVVRALRAPRWQGLVQLLPGIDAARKRADVVFMLRRGAPST